ncbi:3-polyprenyl-4-hydroxybenzoate carboxy-lyase UbiX [Enterobacter hormaechei]|nr:3-polyprenyl-4-hydroxybenzoate carboxy-lyase UbiX [Enterobacter hormaechei]
MKRLIVGISGASGAIYGVRLLQVLRDVADVETHLVMSQAARQTLSLETDLSLRDVQALSDVVHDARDIAASISSGSFKTAGMVILPCSIKTLSGIVNSYTDTLVTRAADVVLKERRPLVLCVRETPLHLGHLRLMTQAAELGAVIMPPVPASIIVRKRWTMSSTRPLTACWISSISTCRKISLPAGRGREAVHKQGA